MALIGCDSCIRSALPFFCSSARAPESWADIFADVRNRQRAYQVASRRYDVVQSYVGTSSIHDLGVNCSSSNGQTRSKVNSY